MFGTLVICLPSDHRGGEVRVKHRGMEETFRSTQFYQSFACWYSDVSHEVLPLISGYRWVLTYNLATDPSQLRPSASLQSANWSVIQDILRPWIDEGPRSRGGNCIFHVLDHDYTEANISLRALKARDLAQVEALKRACRDLPAALFLALLEKQEFGPVEGEYSYDDSDDGKPAARWHELDEVFDEDCKVKILVDLEGQTVTQGLELHQNDLLQDDCLDEFEGEEKYEGYMGNSVRLHVSIPKLRSPLDRKQAVVS